MLEQTLELLAGRPDLAAPLRRAMAGVPLAKPQGHKGGVATDMFVLNLDLAAASAIAKCVAAAVAEGLETTETQGRGLGGFREAWREYAEFIDQQRQQQ